MTELFIDTPLALDGWLEFNRLKWGVMPHKLELTPREKKLPRVRAIVYTNKRGRWCLPPRNPYLPITVETTNTQIPSRLYRQQVTALDLLAEQMKQCGLGGAVVLDPRIQDVRPWFWRGFITSPRYTFYIDSFDETKFDVSFRQKIRRAQRDGYYVKVNAPVEDVFECLLATEKRKRFSHSLTVGDLRLGLELLGPESFRTYVCYSPEGEPVSARVILHANGTRASDWIAGTKTEFLQHGVAQYVLSWALKDLANAGAAGFDHVGANIRSVAASKADAGGRLVTSYSVEQPGVRWFGKQLLGYVKFVQERFS